jgi:hypothetical protein
MPNTIQAAAEGMPKRTTTLHPAGLPERYCMQAEGTCMEPVYMDGSKLLFSNVEPYRYGDDVAIWLRPECVRPGEHQILIKRLVMAPRREFWFSNSRNTIGNLPATVLVEMLNPRRIIQFDPTAILGIHKCLGLVPAGMKTFKISDGEDCGDTEPNGDELDTSFTEDEFHGRLV